MRDRGWNEKPSSDVVRRHRPDYMIALYMGILMLVGLIVIYAIGPQRANVLNNAIGSNYSDSYFFVKQTISLLLAVGVFVGISFIPYTFIIKHAPKVLILGLTACVVLFVASKIGLPIADATYGASRWFNLGIFGSLQPAEIVKFGLLLYLAVFLGNRAKEGKVNDAKATLIPVAIIVGISLLFIVVIQKDLGTGIAMSSIVITMLFLAGMNKKIGLGLAAAVLVMGAVFIFTAPHRVERIMTYLQGDSSSTSDSDSYHIEHAKIAIGSGGLTGVGIGNSVQATGYLPEVINDSVFAVLGETFGFVGLIALMAVFVGLLLRLLKVLDHLIDIRLKLLVAGVFGWFGAHVILNIASMLGIVPLTGITLPLISFGGTSMIFITAALGLVFQLSRYTVHSSRLPKVGETTHENSRSGRRVGRTRYASRSSS
ncbi:FtsW/RodA/SpoVE family cell cycle protein [Candidatus Saccharibacteria bacterium]|nr:FtsW/RodA/SpoVE family cell cycle protein [Candidatus Saccharibacteria bacterium]